MVVMATHGRSGMSRLVLGSVADVVIDKANILVMLIGPRALEKAHWPVCRDRRGGLTLVVSGQDTRPRVVIV